MVATFENMISNSGLSKLPFYFPGLGILLAALSVYAIGLAVTTFIGNWIWSKIDQLLKKLPALGRLYNTLKQILGYGDGKDALFHETVLVSLNHNSSRELGLVTNRVKDESGQEKWIVFVPGVPNPTTGRMLLISPEDVTRINLPVSDTIKSIVAMGKTDQKWTEIK